MKQYVDETGNIHYAIERFGEDGQGLLYKTKNDSLLLRDASLAAFRPETLDDVKLLPLSDIKNMILPSCRLASDAGYVFSIPDGAQPLAAIMDTENSDKWGFYLETGGLTRRLNILIGLAKLFLRLHALPVMYGSLSPYRILISANPKDSDIALLYSDGMSYAMDFKQAENSDPYVAPEVRLGKGGGTLSDIYVFAALAYDLLTLTGHCAVLTDKMKAVFDKALQPKFVSWDDAINRPKMLDFYHLFIEMESTVSVCKTCGAPIFFGEGACTRCGAAAQKLLHAAIYDKISNTIVERGSKVFELSMESQFLYNYHTGNILLHETHKPTIEFILISKGKKLLLVFKNLLDDKAITINEKTVASGEVSAVALPCKVIAIAIPFAHAVRCIDIAIV